MSAVPTQVTTLSQLRELPAQQAPAQVVRAGFSDLAGFELMQRASKALASSTLVPQQFQNNLPNCLIALEMAQRIGASPLMVMQNLYIVHGRPGWSAKFLIASFNQCGRFSALRFEWSGTRGANDWGCRAWAVEKATGEKIVGPLITIQLAHDEGWYGKSGSKWKTIPELMLTYRAAAWLVNTHAPEISMGLNTAEEMTDVYDAAPDASGQFQVTTGELQQQSGTQPSTETPTPTDDPDTKQDADLKAGIERSGDDAPTGPSLQDALALVAKGDDAGAQDLAGQLGPAAKATVAEAIEKRNGAQQPQQRTARRPARDIAAE